MIKNVCTAALAVLFGAGALPAQDAELFSQAVEVRVVNVDVHVTDKKGQPVTGLTRDDFLLYEDGAPVEIAYFYASQGGGALEPSEERREIPTSAGRFDDLIVVIYIDNYWLTPGDRKRVIDDIERFVAEQPPGRTRFMLATHNPGVRIKTPLTSNPQQVLDALREIPEEPTQGLQGPRSRAAVFDSIRAVWDSYADTRFCAPCACGWQQMLGVWESYAVNLGHGVRVADQGLRELLSALSGLPDRKAVLVVNSGVEQRPGLDILQYLMELCPEYEQELANYVFRYDESDTLLDLAAAANSSRATLYPLDAGGIRKDSAATVAIDNPDLRPSGLISQIERSNVQASFQILADATGGRAILNANQPFDELLALQTDFEHGYALGFEPPGEADGEVHQVKVELAKPKRGWELRYRRSYVDKALEQRLVDRAIATMAFQAESNPLGIEASLGATEVLGKEAVNIPIQVRVPIGNLALVPTDDGAETGRFRVFLAARSADGQRTTLREKFFTVSPNEAIDGKHQVTINMRLEPDDYTIGVGVRDEIGTETSYLALRTNAVIGS